jgi:hypothetical protein
VEPCLLLDEREDEPAPRRLASSVSTKSAQTLASRPCLTSRSFSGCGPERFAKAHGPLRPVVERATAPFGLLLAAPIAEMVGVR